MAEPPDDGGPATANRRPRRPWRRRLLLVLPWLVYPAAYLVLRGSGYFVRQHFVSFDPDRADPVRLAEATAGLAGYYVEVQVEEIGCGRIQKPEPYPLERTALVLFLPLRVLELRLRGRHRKRIYIYREAVPQLLLRDYEE